MLPCFPGSPGQPGATVKINIEDCHLTGSRARARARACVRAMGRVDKEAHVDSWLYPKLTYLVSIILTITPAAKLTETDSLSLSLSLHRLINED